MVLFIEGGGEMSTLKKRSTIYLNPQIHKALRLKSAETSRSVSELVNEAVRMALFEDAEDLESFEERKNEPVISFEDAVKELKRNGKL